MDSRAAFEAARYQLMLVEADYPAWLSCWEASRRAALEEAAKVCEDMTDGMDDAPDSIGWWCRVKLGEAALRHRALAQGGAA